MPADRHHTTDGKPSDALRTRREQLEAELSELNRRLVALEQHRPDRTIPVPSRLRLFLTEFPDMTFSPKELMQAVDATEETLRKALTFLTNSGFLIRAAYATYAIDPHKGPLDAGSARVLRGWEDP